MKLINRFHFILMRVLLRLLCIKVLFEHGLHGLTRIFLYFYVDDCLIQDYFAGSKGLYLLETP